MVEIIIKELFKEFNIIKNMEYVKSIGNNNLSVYTTFSNLLDSNKELKNYLANESITIKVKRSYSVAFITLIDILPNNKENINFLIETANNIIINSYESIRVGKYYLRLKVDYKEDCLKILVTDYFNNIIIDDVYWTFSDLKNKVLKKLSILVLVKAWSDRVCGSEYFKYHRMYIYFLKDFNYFLSAINSGIIKIKIRVSYRDKKKPIYRVSFIIKEEDLFSIYDIYR